MLVERHLLPFSSDTHSDHLGADAGADYVRLAHVADAEHEAQLAVPLANDGVAAKQQRLRSHLGARQFREHHAHHEGLHVYEVK